ncbi:MAG: ClbS/DfsB family four-helix bundle protein [Bacteroidota bacterium]
MATKAQLQKKAGIIAALIEARQALLTAASQLPASAQEQVFLGVWSANDVVAHLAGWDEANLAAVQEILDGRVPSFYEHSGPDWREFNALLVARYKQTSLAKTMAAAGETHHRLVECLEALPADVFDKDFGVRFQGYRVTIRRLLEAETKDEGVHRRQVEEFARSLDGAR